MKKILAAVLGAGMCLGTIHAQPDWLQIAEVATALGRLTAVGANYADQHQYNQAKLLQTIADSCRVTNELLFLINKQPTIKEGLYYPIAWLGYDVNHLIKDIRQYHTTNKEVATNNTKKETPEETQIKKIATMLHAYILPTFEATLATYLATSTKDTPEQKKQMLMLQSFGSLSRLLSEYLALEPTSKEAKILLAGIVGHALLTIGEFFKTFRTIEVAQPEATTLIERMKHNARAAAQKARTQITRLTTKK